MVKGILADANCEGHVRVLVRVLQEGYRLEYWTHLRLTTPSFTDLGLKPDDADDVVWQKCQEEEVALVTGNRNKEGPESLEAVIRALNTPASLPVFTLADPDRVLNDRTYAERTADKLLEYLFDIDRHLGAGRHYVP